MADISADQKLEWIQGIICEFEALQVRDEGRLDLLRRRAKMIIGKIYGDSTSYLKDLGSISFYPSIYPCDGSLEEKIWVSGQKRMINLLNTVKEDISLSLPARKAEEKKVRCSNRVFIVHGHDEAPKERLANILRDIGFEPIILHDQPNKGRTLIEKFEEEACDVGFAFIIMTPDDLGIEHSMYEEIQKGIKSGGLCNRARQNVIMELGFFFGKLGRNRVCCLIKGDIERPTDFSGIVYLQFINKVDEIYLSMIKELKSAGYKLKSP
jgi:predicted nucleotide-binding protein